MANEKNFRLRVDLVFPPAASFHADEIRELLLPLYQNAININEGTPNAEISYIEVERCGHQLDPPQPCEIIARWEVGAGRTV